METLTYVLRTNAIVVATKHTDTQTAFHLWSDVAAVDGATADGTAGTESKDAINTYEEEKCCTRSKPRRTKQSARISRRTYSRKGMMDAKEMLQGLCHSYDPSLPYYLLARIPVP